MSVDPMLAKIATKVKSLDQNSHLLRIQKDWNIYVWQVVHYNGQRYDSYEIVGRSGLDETEAASCAKLLLAHLKDASEAFKGKTAIAIHDIGGKKTVSYKDMSAKELSKIKEAGLPFPLVFEHSFHSSKADLKSQIKALDDFGLDLLLKDPLDKEIFTTVVNEMAQSEPHLLLALILKILAKRGSPIRELSYDLPEFSAVHELVSAAKKNKSFRVTRDNLFHWALVVSGFNIQVIEALKSQGFSLSTSWHGLLPAQFAALLGADESVLKALEGDHVELFQYVCQDIPFTEMEGILMDFSEVYDEFIRQARAFMSAVLMKKAGELLEKCPLKSRNPVLLLETMLKAEKVPLDRIDDCIGGICASALLSSSQKIAMIRLLLEKVEKGYPLNHLRAAIVSGGNEEFIRFLIDRGASIDEPQLLHAAAVSCNADALKVLIEKGIDKGQKDEYGRTACDQLIQCMIKCPNLDCVSLAIQNLIGSTFESVLKFLMENDFPFTEQGAIVSICPFLLSTGLSSVAAEFIKRSPFAPGLLHLNPRIRFYKDVLEVWVPRLTRKEMEQVDIENAPLLIYAIKNLDDALLKQLLLKGVSCERRYQGVTPRQLAMQMVKMKKGLEKAQAEKILSLLEHNYEEKTPLHLAAQAGNVEQCKEYLSQTEYLPLDFQGRTPLQEAIIHKQYGLLPLFFEALKEGRIAFPPGEDELISTKLTDIPTFWGGVIVSHTEHVERKATQCGMLLAEAFLQQAEDKDIQVIWDGFHNEVNSNKAFSVLYDLACKGSLPAFKRAYQWIHAQFAEIAEEPLIAAIAAKNLDAARWLCEVEPGIAAQAGREAFQLATQRSDVPMLKLLVQQGAFNEGVDLKTHLEWAADHDEAELFSMMVDRLKYDVSGRLASLMPKILAAPEQKILKKVIAKCANLSAEDADKAIQAIAVSFGNVKDMPSYLLFYLMRHAQSLSEWEAQIRNFKRICTLFEQDKTLIELIAPDAFFKEVFEEIFEKFHKRLAKDKNIIDNLFALFQNVRTKNQLALFFNALQRGSSLEEIEQALPMALEKDEAGVPSLAQFKLCPKEKKAQWLKYFAVSGFRGGFEHAWKTVNEEKDEDLILLGLKALEKIGRNIPAKKAQRRLSVFFEHQNEAVRCQAAKALSAVVPDDKSGNSKWDIVNLLGNSSKENKLMLLELLSNYEWDLEGDFGITNIILQYAESEDRDLRVQSALTLSRIQEERALLRAAEIVKSHDWDFMDGHFGEDRKFFPGAWWMFIYPPEFHNSRSAILGRIKDGLAFIHRDAISAEVEKRRKDLKENPFIKKLENLPKSCRYVPIPIHYPTQRGCYLMRGLKARKGDPLFAASIRDLIFKGCGNSDLTLFDKEFTFGSWSKVGAIFATHSLGMAHQYFTEAQGCLILIDPAYYHSQQRKGFARIEFESAINNVFYRGIPKNAIKLIYISSTFKHDLQLLNGDRNIDDAFRSKLTSDAFKDCSFEDLRQFRIYLHEQMEPLSTAESGPVTIHSLQFHKTFFDAFRFMEHKEQIEIRLAKDGVEEIKVTDIAEETCKAVIARQVIEEKYGKDLFMSQDEMLSQLDDGAFVKQLPKVFELLHLDKLPFKEVRARHGRNEAGERATVYDHTVEMISGAHGGFGLRTDLNLSSMAPDKARRLLRLAALYHYVGQLDQTKERKEKLMERSADIANAHIHTHMKL